MDPKHNVSAASFYRWKKFGGMELKDARRYRQLEKENNELKQILADSLLEDPGFGRGERKKMVGPPHKRRALQSVVAAGRCSQRRACRYLGLHRSSHRHTPKQSSDWLLRLHAQIETLSDKYPRLGYRKLVRLLRKEGWQVGRKLVQRIRREHGLRVKRWTKRPRRRGRSTGAIPTKAQRVNHVRGWDFISDRTDNGGKLRILSVIDEYSRECLALHVARQLTATDLIAVMGQLVAQRGVPAHVRSDNGSEFVARTLQSWLAQRQIKTLYIAPSSPWQNGHAESFHGSLRDECLDRELMLERGRGARPHRGLSPLLQRRAAPRGPRLPHAQAGVQRSPNSEHQSGRHRVSRLIHRQKLLTDTTNPNLSHVLDQSRGLDHSTKLVASKRSTTSFSQAFYGVRSSELNEADVAKASSKGAGTASFLEGKMILTSARQPGAVNGQTGIKFDAYRRWTARPFMPDLTFAETQRRAAALECRGRGVAGRSR